MGEAVVDVVVNSYAGDAPFLAPMMRHLSRALSGAPRGRRILVVDPSPPQGRFTGRAADDAAASFMRDVEALRGEGVIDDIHVVDWDPAAVAGVMERWFGDPTTPTRCSHGSAIYQYCVAVDACRAPYALHLDSDMLLSSPDAGGWVADAVRLLRSHPDAITVQCMGGPPMATTLAQLVFGRSARPQPPVEPWGRGGNVSTRVFVVDRERLDRCLLPLRRSDPQERLEQALTATAQAKGMTRYTLTADHSYALHPLTHTGRYARVVPDLIWAVEHDVYPFRRSGYRWDVRVDGRHYVPWKLAIARARIGHALNRTSVGGRGRFGGAGA